MSPVAGKVQHRGPVFSASRGRACAGLLLMGAIGVVLGLSSVAIVRGQESAASQPASQPASRPAVRFSFVDVYVDSAGQPLAAYQFELAAKVGQVKIVGVEGGEHAAFRQPPYYDPAALARNRIIIAAFNTGSDLPKGKTRVARIHLQITGERQPEYTIKLDVAASPDGQKISGATAAVRQGGSS